MDADSDVVAAQDGDREAFGRLYRRYARPVYVQIVSYLRDRQDSEDALQAAFLAAWVSLPRLRRPRRFVGWLFSIARNEARGRLRRPARSMTLLPNADELTGRRPDGGEDIDGLQELVAGLRPESRSVVLLRAVEGWDAGEIAAAQRISASTVRRRYAQAIEHLRAGLSRMKPDDTQTRTTRRRNLP